MNEVGTTAIFNLYFIWCKIKIWKHEGFSWSIQSFLKTYGKTITSENTDEGTCV